MTADVEQPIDAPVETSTSDAATDLTPHGSEPA